jgi:hypothetical protein
MKLDGLYGMPAFRVSGQFQSLDVRPEHLIRGAEDPFVLTNLFSFIGKELDVAAVVVDLRAGLSELSSGLLLDPRVHRVLVTTLSDQSLKGTAQELDIIGRLAPVRANTDDPVPALIFSRVPSTPGADRLLDDAKLFLMDHVRDTILDDDSDEVEAIALSSAHDQRLMALPGDWEEVLRRIEHGQIMRELAPLTDWLQVSEGSSEDLSVSQPDIQGDVDSKRERLSGFAKDLIYAERGVVNEFLSTPPLENMAQDFTARVPIVVVVGSKGSGKTYTYLQLAYRKTWDRFTEDAGISDKSLPARVCPMLMSKNIEDKAKSVVEEALAATITALG